MAPHRPFLGALVALLLTACAASAAGPSSSATGSTSSVAAASTAAGSSASGATVPLPTVGGVGVLPGPLPTEAPGSPDAPGASTSTSTSTTLPEEKTVGGAALGNKVLMLGDSILASTSKRYSNDMCQALVPNGWQVEIEAEVSRPILWGQQVQNELLKKSNTFGAALIFLGNNFGGDENDFFSRYNAMIEKFGTIPVVLVTLTEFEPEQARLNAIIRNLAGVHPNTFVVDWATLSTANGMLGKDGLHLTPAGRAALAGAVAPVFGTAPVGPGKCLDSKHTDDSAGSVDGGTNTGIYQTPASTPKTTPRTTAGGSGGGTDTTVDTGGGGGSGTTHPGTTAGETTPKTEPPATTPKTTPKTEPATTLPGP